MNTMKKIILFCLFSVIGMTIQAYDFEVDGIFYNLESSTEACVTFGDSAYSGRIIIPETVKYKSKTLSVIKLGDKAFRDCTQLESVILPNTIKSLSPYAFYNCTSLQFIKLPDNLQSLESGTFEGCTELTDIYLPNTIKSISDNTFYGCSSLINIDLPSHLAFMGQSAFAYCTGIKSITLPNTLTSISDNSFQGCTSLYNVSLGNLLASIGDYAFCGCTSLLSIDIPKSVISIGKYALYECSNLEVIRVHWRIPISVNESTFPKTQKGIYATSLSIPKGTNDFYSRMPIWKEFWEINEDESIVEDYTDFSVPLPYTQSFETSFGDFFYYPMANVPTWHISNGAAVCNINSEKTRTNYLISPPILLKHIDSAYIQSKIKIESSRPSTLTILISDNVDYENIDAGWTILYQGVPPKNDCIYVQIPKSFLNSKVNIAFCYETIFSSGSCDVYNLNVYEGSAPKDPEIDPIPHHVGENLLANSGFEEWNGSNPVNWVSSTTASSAILSRSTYAHSGNYSVQVDGSPYANNRLAYKELTLLPGTYYIRFYAKAVTANGASVRPGYVMVESDYVISNSYKFGDYIDNITNKKWTEVSHSFTLSEKTIINLLIMNPKYPGTPVLIDDFGLFTEDGGITENDEPGPIDAKSVTIAEFKAASVGEQYYQLTGTVSGLKSGDLYGNFDLTDATGTVYVYGLLSEPGGAKKHFLDLAAAKGIVEGCTLTLVGKRGEYNGNIEVTDAYFVSCEGGGTPTPPTPPDPVEGKKLSEFKNGDFETWVDDKTPELWKSSTTASSATLAKSTDAHSGSYAVQVQGATSGNKRLASTELALEAGTYTYSFYAKGDGAAAAVASGYVPLVSDGNVGQYVYMPDSNGRTQYTDVSSAKWTKVSGTFTLTAATAVNLIIMNSKNPGEDILIDDFSIMQNGYNTINDINNGNITETEYYSVSGIRLTSPRKGLNIIRISNGNVKKVMLR